MTNPPIHAAGPARLIAGLVTVEHRFELPLRADGTGSISVFAREVREEGAEAARRPWLVFLQGGPGGASPRPGGHAWIGVAARRYRVLLLDQRGTGVSTPATFQSLRALGGAAAQADYLAELRSDGIVRDCEAIRRVLAGDEPWTVLGQSYGGFCATHYLCAAPAGLAAVLITGGLPPLDAHPDDIYRRTYPRVRERNARYYARYPEDVARVQELVRVLARTDVRLPSGDRLTPRRFLALGLELGFSDGFETLHHLLEQAFVPGVGEVAYTFLRAFEATQHYDTSPIFSTLHEACYTQGFASRWSAQRVRAEFPEFAEALADGSAGDEVPVLFTGEMIYPWMFTDIAALRPLREAAELLAQKDDWPPLYDADVLAQNTVPCAAAIYVDDMYVERTFSEETAARIQGLSAWVTDQHLHNGLRADGPAVLGELFARLG